MKVFKHWLKILLYASIGFLLYYLLKFDYLIFSEISFDYILAISSIILLWGGFYASTLSWRIALKQHGFIISRKLAVHSHGISVFAKYIPGKLWVIIGRASVAAKEKYSVKVFSTISLKEQLVYLFVGLLISLIGLVFVDINPYFLLIVLATVLGLGLFLFSEKIYRFALSLFQRIFRKELDVPFVGIKELMHIGLATFTYWTFWSIGFFLLCKSISPEISIVAAFAFPLSVSYGLLAVFIPGGIGVREGIIVLVLTSLGVEAQLSVTISVVSRLWFITGEIFIFLLALFFRKEREL
ncbi:MAG: lysylphosphatidylglycerol synthase domain-containing protein [Prolixibacteraceae bacterium]|jgi:uncharacterized membrane protein YbhN (UPF0104 family)|nr:lysylphosphatidylglycerol synthase domain-containing protein [Prolixibacteraceae bacterium]